MDSCLGKMLSSRPESVTIPTKARALEILQHSSVSVPWGFYVTDIGNMDGLVLLNDKVLVQLIPRGRKLEIHGCCKLRDRAQMGEPFAKLLEWIAQHGWTQIYTTAPDDRTALKNMLSNLGFTEYKSRWIYGHGPGNNGGGISRRQHDKRRFKCAFAEERHQQG